jgi:hypothetical protein
LESFSRTGFSAIGFFNIDAGALEAETFGNSILSKFGGEFT